MSRSGGTTTSTPRNRGVRFSIITRMTGRNVFGLSLNGRNRAKREAQAWWDAYLAKSPVRDLKARTCGHPGLQAPNRQSGLPSPRTPPARGSIATASWCGSRSPRDAYRPDYGYRVEADQEVTMGMRLDAEITGRLRRMLDSMTNPDSRPSCNSARLRSTRGHIRGVMAGTRRRPQAHRDIVPDKRSGSAQEKNRTILQFAVRASRNHQGRQPDHGRVRQAERPSARPAWPRLSRHPQLRIGKRLGRGRLVRHGLSRRHHQPQRKAVHGIPLHRSGTAPPVATFAAFGRKRSRGFSNCSTSKSAANSSRSRKRPCTRDYLSRIARGPWHFRAVVNVIRSDPTLRRLNVTFIVWDGSPNDLTDPSRACCRSSNCSRRPTGQAGPKPINTAPTLAWTSRSPSGDQRRRPAQPLGRSRSALFPDPALSQRHGGGGHDLRRRVSGRTRSSAVSRSSPSMPTPACWSARARSNSA